MLTLKNIKKEYVTKGFKQEVLKNLSISFRRNEFVSILGPSGSGKTTFLNIIGGLDHYSSGDLIVNGISTKKYNDSSWDSYRCFHIGFIFQNYNLISHLSIFKNVELSLVLSGVKKRRKRVIDALSKVGLKEHMHKKPSELSGGQIQRVAIARALINDPDIILADEPTGALDSKTSVEIMELIKKVSENKLVIMVTHNEELASKYSNRIIRLSDGKIISDTNPLNYDEKIKKFKPRKTKMRYKTALSLSLNNLKTKKGRTILTSVASSIGIIGIALILSISNGFKKQINAYEKNTLSSFPIVVSSTKAINKEELSEGENGYIQQRDFTNEKCLFLYEHIENNKLHENKITENYIDFVNSIEDKYLNAISYQRLTNLNLVTSYDNNYKIINDITSKFIELPIDLDNKSFLKDNYDLLAGEYPKSPSELVLIVDSKNRIDKNLLDIMFTGYNDDKINFEKIIGRELKLVLNDDYYTRVSDNFYIKKEANYELYNNPNNKSLKLVGIVRGKKNNKLSKVIDEFNGSMESVSKIGYSTKLINEVIKINENSNIVKSQKESETLVFMPNVSYDGAKLTKQKALSMLGANSIPESIYIYPKNFESKDKIVKYLDKYNNKKDNKNKVFYTDYASEISNLSSNIMDGITIVLIAFSSISLLVSSIMIAIIIYVSVLERTKEIGILRSIGARKKDIIRVFNSETFIIGLLSGLFAIAVAKLLLIPINKILYNLTDLKNIGILSMKHSVVLIIVSTLLTVIAGFIPSVKASHKDPVEALRVE